MFRLSTLRKQHGDDVENSQINDALIEEKARGKIPMDPATDLARMTDQSLEAARTDKELMERFNPQRTDNQVRSRLANVDGVAVPDLPIFKTALGSVFLMNQGKAIDAALSKRVMQDDPANQEFEDKHPRARGRFAPKGTFDTAAGEQIHIDDIAGLSAGKDGLNVDHKDGSTKTVAPEESQDFLEWHGKHIAAQEHAAQFVSPNDATKLSLAQSIENLNSPKQEWLMRVSAEIDKFSGLKSQSLPAVGDWHDPQTGSDTENSTYTAVAKVPDKETLDYAGALKGLAANQKAVLDIMLDPKGADTLYHISVPHDTSDAQWMQNLKQLQTVLDKAGLNSRTFVKTEHGTDVAIFEKGGQKQLEAVQRVTQFLPGATSEHSLCTGNFIGAAPQKGQDDQAQRDASAQVFRSIIYQYEKARGVHYQSKEEYPLEEEQNQAAQKQQMQQSSNRGLGSSLPILGKMGSRNAGGAGRVSAGR